MYKSLLASIALIAFLMNGLAAQEFVSNETSDQLVKWKSTTHDFGEIKQGNPVSVDFAFENVSDEPIFIDNVRTTCGCTAPTWSKDPIAPGESAFIELEYNAKKEGPFNKPARVYLSGKKEPVMIYIKGKVVPKS